MRMFKFTVVVWLSLSAGTVPGLAQEVTAAPVSQIIAQSDEALDRRDVNKAFALIRAALAAHPEDERLLLQQARIYVYQRRDAQALDLVNGVLRKHPESRDARLTLAQICGYHDKYRQSDELYRQLLTADPNDEAAAVGLIHNLVLEGKRQLARQELEKALQLHPNSLRLQQYSDYLQPSKAAEAREGQAELFHRIQAGETYFTDNAGNRALYSSQGVSYDLARNFSTRFRMDESSLWKTGVQPATVLTGTEDLRIRLNKYLAVRGSGGAVRFADTNSEAVYSGDLELYPVRGLQLSGGYSQFPIVPTFDAAQFDLLAAGWHARAGYNARNFSLNGSFFLTHYSDGNDAEREYGEMMKWFGSGPVSLGGGYAVRHIRFQQQLAHGYFSPLQYWSHLGEAGIRVRVGRVYRGEFIGYAGAERENPAAYNLAGEALVRNEFFIRRWEVDINYSRFHLAQASGAFHADMLSAALGFRF